MVKRVDKTRKRTDRTNVQARVKARSNGARALMALLAQSVTVVPIREKTHPIAKEGKHAEKLRKSVIHPRQ